MCRLHFLPLLTRHDKTTKTCPDKVNIEFHLKLVVISRNGVSLNIHGLNHPSNFPHPAIAWHLRLAILGLVKVAMPKRVLMSSAI